MQLRVRPTFHPQRPDRLHLAVEAQPTGQGPGKTGGAFRAAVDLADGEVLALVGLAPTPRSAAQHAPPRGAKTTGEPPVADEGTELIVLVVPERAGQGAKGAATPLTPERREGRAPLFGPRGRSDGTP
jgi:hypothetical protein